MHPAPVLPIGVTTVAIHLACSLRIEHPAPVKRRSRHGSLTPRHASSTFVAIPPPIPHRSRPSQPPTIPPLIPVAGRATSGSSSLAAHDLLFLMRSLRLGCRGVIFVCSCASVFRFAQPAVPDFVCFDLGEVVIHNDMVGLASVRIHGIQQLL
jgi:hypothetical protein